MEGEIAVMYYEDGGRGHEERMQATSRSGKVEEIDSSSSPQKEPKSTNILILIS